jgi:hypothetical protein
MKLIIHLTLPSRTLETVTVAQLVKNYLRLTETDSAVTDDWTAGAPRQAPGSAQPTIQLVGGGASSPRKVTSHLHLHAGG